MHLNTRQEYISNFFFSAVYIHKYQIKNPTSFLTKLRFYWLSLAGQTLRHYLKPLQILVILLFHYKAECLFPKTMDVVPEIVRLNLVLYVSYIFRETVHNVSSKLPYYI